MSGCNIQHFFARAVVNRQFHMDDRNGDIAHDSRSGDIQERIIRRKLVAVGERGGQVVKVFVVVLCLLEQQFRFAVVQFLDRLTIACNGTGLYFGIPPVADGWIQHYGEPHQ